VTLRYIIMALLLSGCANHPLDCAMGLSLWQGYCPTPGTRGYEIEQARYPQPRIWSKLGATGEQFAKDRYACMQEARSNISGASVMGGFRTANGVVLPGNGQAYSRETISQPLFEACLEARGYQ
jgi:hypothetical protein